MSQILIAVLASWKKPNIRKTDQCAAQLKAINTRCTQMIVFLQSSGGCIEVVLT